jgi:hypothetical protein
MKYEIHCRVHKSASLVPILFHIRPVSIHTFPPYFKDPFYYYPLIYAYVSLQVMLACYFKLLFYTGLFRLKKYASYSIYE